MSRAASVLTSKFYKDLPKSGVIFFWLFIISLFARQFYLHAGVYSGSEALFFNDGLRILLGLVNFFAVVSAVIYSWFYYAKLDDRKMAIVKSMCYAALFYIVLIVSSAIHPGLQPLNNPMLSDDYYRLSVLVFFATLLDPVFNKFIKNVYVKIVAQIVAIQLVSLLVSLVVLVVVTSFADVNSTEYNQTMKNFFKFYWPGSFIILGVILVNFLGPLAAASLVVINFITAVLMVFYSATWSDFSFNSILAWLIFGAVFFKVELQSKLQRMNS